MIKVGLVGYGYWGINLLRNFMNAKNCTVKTVCDPRPDRLEVAKRSYPTVDLTRAYDDLLKDPEIDAIILATPVFSHYPLAKQALLAGKHVLVEKPFTASVAHAEELIELAEQRGLVIMVDHTFLYTGSVQKIKALCEAGEIGKLQYFDSTRINLGLFQSDVNVIWDLAPHDISILFHLISRQPVSLTATGKAHAINKIENIAYLTLHFDSDFIAHFTCSWISPLKVRRILIGGDRKMVLYDDVEPTEKVKIYDTTYKVDTSEQEKYKMMVDYRTGDIFIPKVAQKEALAEMAADFVSSILDNKKPMVDGHKGLEVVRVLEAAETSIKQNGKEIYL
ncbi:Gfo/Idh/MocA family oxidoreductase [Nibrella saemangeumensis]|uniref:Gfo/Idh/MocA family oxidoreductase n=1 Tax=Nibrella saemangeumensis TaxID=1084526 RepID=A0ABP8NRF5_9BACT